MNAVNKLKNVIYKFVIKYLDVLFFTFIISLKALYYNNVVLPGYTDCRIPIISSILVLISFSLLFKNKGRVVYLYILDLVLTIIFVSDLVYYSYSKDVISLNTIQNGTMLGGVKDSLISLLQISDFIYFLDCILVIPAILILYKKLKTEREQTRVYKRIISFIIVLFIGVLADGMQLYDLSVNQPRLISTMFNRVYLLRVLGPINFHVLDTYNVVSTNILKIKKIDAGEEQDIKKYLADKNLPKGSNFSNAAKGKNLIIIQVEALQQFVINKKINGQEITPNLNRWINKSLYFDNYFYQVAAGNTSDAEFLSNNSLYPAKSGTAYQLYCGDTLNSLAKEFDKNGYYSAALHGFTESFWNRNVMYKTEGFDKFYGEQSYNIDEVVGMGLSDKSFLTQSIEKIKKLKQPYFAFTITLSSHYPFNDVKKYGDFDTGQYKNTLMGNYLQGIHYTDKQLGMFLDNLEKQGILDNSIVVLYGDHYAIPKNEPDTLYKFDNIKNATDLDWYEEQKVPMFIHFPEDQNSGVNHLYSGQIDLYPTIANLFGINNKYMFGEDLLNSKDNLVKFRNGSFTNGKVFYVSYSDTYYDIESRKKIKETDELKNLKNETTTELNYSDEILDNDLIEKFLQEDKQNTK